MVFERPWAFRADQRVDAVDLILLARRPVEAVDHSLRRSRRLGGDQKLDKLTLDKRRRMAIEHS